MVIRWSCCISNKTFLNTVQFYKNLFSSIIVTLCIVLANLIPHDGPKHCIFCRDGVSLSKNAFFCCLAWCFYNMHYPPRMGTLSGKIPRSHPILLVGKWYPCCGAPWFPIKTVNRTTPDINLSTVAFFMPHLG